MSAVLDQRVEDRRLLLVERTVGIAKQVFDAEHNDRERVLDRLAGVVEAGQRAMVPLVDAYMTTAVRATGETAKHRGLLGTDYVALRGVPTRDVYDRVFGALGGQLLEGADFHTAMEAARSRLEREVRTDLQLTQVRVAQALISEDPNIAGWKRGVVGTCEYCASQAGQEFSDQDPMPFHENCRCSVQPVFADEPITNRIEGEIRDKELGPVLDKSVPAPVPASAALERAETGVAKAEVRLSKAMESGNAERIQKAETALSDAQEALDSV